MKQVKVGDKFNFGTWKWIVTRIGKNSLDEEVDGFYASRIVDNDRKTAIGEYFDDEEICQLEWIEPEPTISEEVKKRIDKFASKYLCSNCEILLHEKTHSMIEKKN